MPITLMVVYATHCAYYDVQLLVIVPDTLQRY